MAGNHVDLLGEHDGKLDSFLRYITIITSHADAFMTFHFDSFQKAQIGYVWFKVLALCEVFFSCVLTGFAACQRDYYRRICAQIVFSIWDYFLTFSSTNNWQDSLFDDEHDCKPDSLFTTFCLVSQLADAFTTAHHDVLFWARGYVYHLSWA